MRNKTTKLAIIALTVALATACSGSRGVAHFNFDPSKEMSGTKFALKDINRDLPTDWDDYNYVVLEYKISTAQRFQLGFTTDDGYNEVRVMSYVPNAWNKLAIPLKYFTELPSPAVDIAATMNHARYTGWVNLGGKRGPLHGVDSIGVRMRRAIGQQSIDIRNVTLSVEDPGDEYLETTPAIDEFGQQIRVDYPDKVSTLEQLQAQWAAEDAITVDASSDYGYSKYGGYLAKRVEATGFFRTEQIDGRWWFVDPEGYLFLSVGVDCMSPGGGGYITNYEHRPWLYKELPPEELAVTRRDGSKSYSFGT